MVDEHLWDETTVHQFMMLVENLLLQKSEAGFDEFTASLRDYQAEWYDGLYS
jgi:hypothetical protein